MSIFHTNFKVDSGGWGKDDGPWDTGIGTEETDGIDSGSSDPPVHAGIQESESCHKRSLWTKHYSVSSLWRHSTLTSPTTRSGFQLRSINEQLWVPVTGMETRFEVDKLIRTAHHSSQPPTDLADWQTESCLTCGTLTTLTNYYHFLLLLFVFRSELPCFSFGAWFCEPRFPIHWCICFDCIPYD